MMMDSTAFLRLGIAPAPPLAALAAAPGLPSTFRNVSSIRLITEKANLKKNSNKHSNNGYKRMPIRCFRQNKGSASGSQSGGFPSPNAKAALEALLCFSQWTAAEDHSKDINEHKKQAVQKLLDKKDGEGEMIMMRVYKKYQKASSGQIKYDAALALVQFLIHQGTTESLGNAIRFMNELERMTDSPPSDAKRHLYRAIIYTLLGENRDATQSWNIYVRTIGSGPPRR